MFLQLRLNRPNFLIMDEPTNHIDIDGKEELEEQLSTADATLLMTSHDRRFIDNLANRFLLIEGGRLVEIQDPEVFYAASIQPEGSQPEGSQPEGSEHDGLARHSGALTEPELPVDSGQAAETTESLEAEVLERIIELEQKLSDDLARKPKYQKPKLQLQWQEELAVLNARLEES
jgi:ATP-binding cassette subfamily F protein 3